VQLIWDGRDDPVMATQGLFASTDLSTSSRWLGSDFRYVRWFSQFDFYRKVASVAGSPVTWGQSMRVGLAHAQGQELIPDARFFAGGSFSVRGYDTESLGPTEDLGGTIVPVGGAALLVVNEELRLPLLAGITGVVFLDAGQVWAKIGDFGKELAKSFGLGLRAATPVGLFRLDVARPLDAPRGTKGVRFTLGFGNVF
jgi:outer membrane protein assembly factor BamA